ncbi:MAG: glycosyltransferase family 2 protein [Nitrososphaerota archaeon]
MTTEIFPKVTVIVSNYNGWSRGTLKNCLESLIKADYPNLEIIVVDNSSKDGSTYFINKYFGGIRCIVNNENNYSSGLNLGIKKSKGKYVIFFNDDVIVSPHIIRQAVKIMESDETIALAQFKLINFFYRNKIDCIGETTDIYGNSVEIAHDEIDHGQYNVPMEILCAAGSACILRRSIIKRIGIYDPKFVIGYEDLDFALRVWLSGYKVIFIPNTDVFHIRGASYTGKSPEIEKLRLKVKEHFYKNQISTIIKNYSFKNLIKAVPIVLIMYLLIAIGEVFLRKNLALAFARFKAIIWNLSELPYLLHHRRNVQQIIRKHPDEVFTRLMAENQFKFIKYYIKWKKIL